MAAWCWCCRGRVGCTAAAGAVLLVVSALLALHTVCLTPKSHQLLSRLAARHCCSPPATLGKLLRLVRCQGGKARSHSSLSYSP